MIDSGHLDTDDGETEAAALASAASAVLTAVGAEVDYYGPEPDWFDRDAVTVVVREDELDPDVMPINPVLRLVRDLQAGEILELVALHLPAPGIDILRRKGYRTWTVDDDGGTHTFITPNA